LLKVSFANDATTEQLFTHAQANAVTQDGVLGQLDINVYSGRGASEWASGHGELLQNYLGFSNFA
jgi:hypothetical protein